MFEVQGLDDATQQSRTGQNLKLGIEVSRIVYGAVDHRYALPRVNRIVFEVDLHSRRRFVKVGFARHIDRRQRRYERGHAKHEPKTFAYGPPVVEQMDFAFATVRPIAIDSAAIIRRIIEPPIDFARFVFTLNEFGCLVHRLWNHPHGKLRRCGRYRANQTSDYASAG